MKFQLLVERIWWKQDLKRAVNFYFTLKCELTQYLQPILKKRNQAPGSEQRLEEYWILNMIII